MSSPFVLQIINSLPLDVVVVYDDLISIQSGRLSELQYTAPLIKAGETFCMPLELVGKAAFRVRPNG